MSDSNNVIMLESRIQELQTENNKLKLENNKLNKIIEEIITLKYTDSQKEVSSTTH